MTDKNLQQPAKKETSRKKLYRSLLFVLLIGGGIWLWEEVIENRVIPKRFGVVKKSSVYRSGRILAPLIEKTLRKYNIKVIVDLTSDEPDSEEQQAEKQAAAELNIKRLVFPLRGNGTGDINKYAEAVAAIVQAERDSSPVLVHCSAGAQRTGGVIATYRLLVEKKDAPFVLREMKHYGRADKNIELLTYLDSHMKELAELLRKMNVIDHIPSPIPQLHPDEND